MPALPTSIAAETAPWRPTPAIRSWSARRRRVGALDGRPERLDGGQGGAGVGRVEVTVDRGRPLRHRRDQRGAVGDRLVGRWAQPALQRPRGSNLADATGSALAVDGGDRVAEAADQVGRAVGLLAARRPRAVTAPVFMSGAGYSAMSSMLTPASPSARASSATVPGRLETTTRSSRSGPPASSASSSRAAVLGGARVPGGDRLAVAVADQLGGVAEAGGDRVDRRRRPRRGCWRRCRPRSPGWSRRRGSSRGSSDRPPPGSARSPRELRGRLGDEGVGEHVREVADRRHQAVVGLGVDRLRPGAEAGDESLQAVVEDSARASLGRASGTSGRPSKRSARAFSTPAVSAPASGWPPMKRSSSPKRGDQLALGRADVADHGLGADGRERRGDLIRKRPDRRRAEDRVGPLAGVGERIGGAVDRAQLDRSVEGGPRPAPADHLGAVEPRPWRRARSSRRSGRRRGRRSSSGQVGFAAPGPDRGGEAVEHRDGVVPGDAGVGDRLPVGERPVAVAASGCPRR